MNFYLALGVGLLAIGTAALAGGTAPREDDENMWLQLLGITFIIFGAAFVGVAA